jgi:hypothetical protein
MEISVVRQRLNETIERAKRRAAERRARTDEAGHAYERFLDRIAIPLFRQITNVLRADGHMFSMFTPSGSVRLMSDRHAEDYIEILLDTADAEPRVVGHVSRSHGRRIAETERPIGDPATLSEDELLAFVMKELEPFVER